MLNNNNVGTGREVLRLDALSEAIKRFERGSCKHCSIKEMENGVL